MSYFPNTDATPTAFNPSTAFAGMPSFMTYNPLFQFWTLSMEAWTSVFTAWTGAAAAVPGAGTTSPAAPISDADGQLEVPKAFKADTDRELFA